MWSISWDWLVAILVCVFPGSKYLHRRHLRLRDQDADHVQDWMLQVKVMVIVVMMMMMMGIMVMSMILLLLVRINYVDCDFGDNVSLL